MASRIPTSTSVTESAVIEAPFSSVWHLVKLENFNHFWSALSKSESVKGVSPETDVVKWTFKDGTVLEVKQEEHSTINHYITYSVITAQPELSYHSVLSTIKLFAVTSGELEGSTYVEWSGNFSNDADAGMLLSMVINPDLADLSFRRDPGCKVQAPRGSGGSRQGREEGLSGYVGDGQERLKWWHKQGFMKYRGSFAPSGCESTLTTAWHKRD